MTCIVGLEHKGDVWLGGDSAGARNDWSIKRRDDAKVFKLRTGNNFVAFGFTTSFRMGQLLRFSLTLPTQECKDPYEYMCTVFINSVRECLRHGGYTTIENNVETGGRFLVGYHKKLYCIDHDFQVGRSLSGYDAVGCGDALALGSLHTTQKLVKHPRERISLALKAAEAFSAGVQRPFSIIQV